MIEGVSLRFSHAFAAFAAKAHKVFSGAHAAGKSFSSFRACGREILRGLSTVMTAFWLI
jgi:hypothetical protein